LQDLPEAPESLEYLIEIYHSVNTGEALTFTEIKAWVDLTGVRLEGWEAKLLIRMNREIKEAFHNG